MNTNHTPGPWSVIEDQVYSLNEYHTAIEKGYEHEIAIGEALIVETGGNEANAKLIAAAPDLLDAARNLRHFIKTWNDVSMNDQQLQTLMCIESKIDQLLGPAIKKATE